MRIFGTEVYELREPAEQDERSRRLSELAEEIEATGRKLLRAVQEQAALVRRERQSGFETEWLRADQERLAVALGNLEKEKRGLLAT